MQLAETAYRARESAELTQTELGSFSERDHRP